MFYQVEPEMVEMLRARSHNDITIVSNQVIYSTKEIKWLPLLDADFILPQDPEPKVVDSAYFFVKYIYSYIKYGDWGKAKYLLSGLGLLNEFYRVIKDDEIITCIRAPMTPTNFIDYDDLICDTINNLNFNLLRVKIDMAPPDILSYCFRNTIVYCNDVWYVFLNHGWSANSDDELLKYISECVRNLLDTSFSLTLKQTPIGKLRVALTDDKFMEKCDMGHFVRFRNGVYCLATETFRDGKPSDYCIKTLNVNYDVSCDYSRAKDFFKTIFLDDDLYEWALAYFASFFEPKNSDKLFIVMRGIGDNGKTMLGSLIASAFGNYINRPDISQLVNARKSSSGVTPDWIANDRVRAIMYTEVSETTVLNDGIIKTITGGEYSMKARALYCKEQDIIVNAKVCIMCNFSFTMGTLDNAMIRRLRVLPFKTIFKAKPDPANVYEKQLDTRFDISGMQKEFVMFLLIEGYSKYKQSGLPYSATLDDATNMFVNNGDDLYRFIDETYDFVDSNVIFAESVFISYKNWYKKNCTNKHLSNVDFKRLLQQKKVLFNSEKTKILNLIAKSTAKRVVFAKEE